MNHFLVIIHRLFLGIFFVITIVKLTSSFHYLFLYSFILKTFLHRIIFFIKFWNKHIIILFPLIIYRINIIKLNANLSIIPIIESEESITVFELGEPSDKQVSIF